VKRRQTAKHTKVMQL
ncbi:outer membrane protein ompV, partial [Vibrio parahaemolyticus V-223/04]